MQILFRRLFSYSTRFIAVCWLVYLFTATIAHAYSNLAEKHYQALIFDTDLEQAKLQLGLTNLSSEKLAFIQVLIRLTGDQSIAQTRAVSSKSNRFYQNSVTKLQEEENKGNPYQIFSFDKNKVNQLISDSKKTIWPFPRPPLVMLLRVIESSGDVNLLTSNELSPELLKILIDSERQRDIRIQLLQNPIHNPYFTDAIPEVDSPIYEAITSSTKSAHFAAISMSQTTSSFSFHVINQFSSQRISVQIQSRDLEAGFYRSVQQAMNGLYQLDSPQFLHYNQIQLNIHNIATYADLESFEQILKSIRAIDSFRPVELKANTLSYEVTVSLSEQQLFENLLDFSQLYWPTDTTSATSQSNLSTPTEITSSTDIGHSENVSDLDGEPLEEQQNQQTLQPTLLEGSINLRFQRAGLATNPPKVNPDIIEQSKTSNPLNATNPTVFE